MPLRQSGSDQDVSYDVKELMATGRPQAQSVAIALRVNGKDRKVGVKKVKGEVGVKK